MLGCRNCTDALYLARHGYEVYVVDPHNEPLKRFDESAAKEGLTLVTYNQGFKAFLKNNHPSDFDAILALNSLQQILHEDVVSIVNLMRSSRGINAIEAEWENKPSQLRTVSSWDSRFLQPGELRGLYPTDTLLCYREWEGPSEVTYKSKGPSWHHVLIVADMEKSPEIMRGKEAKISKKVH